MTSPMMRLAAQAITPEQAAKAVSRARRAQQRICLHGSPQAIGRAIARLARAQELERMVRARTGQPTPSRELMKIARLDAETQRAAIEAAGKGAVLPDFPRAATGSSPVGGHAVGAPESEAPAASTPPCRLHPTQPAIGCALCGLDPVRQWRAQDAARHDPVGLPQRYGCDW